MEDDILTVIREKFERAAEREAKNRRNYLDDIRFARLGEQWPEAIKRQREDENRPALVINRMPSFIRQVVNEARQNRPAITIIPADSGADPETAKMLSGLVRNIQIASDADVAYDTAVEGAVSGGFGYFRINIGYASEDTFDADIVIERITDPLTVFGDPDSEAADSSDWNCAFVVSTMTKEAFTAKYKNAEPVDFDDLGYSKLGAPWVDGDNIMVAEYWMREDEPGEVVALSNGTVIRGEEYAERAEELAQLGIQEVGRRPVVRKKVTQQIVTGAEVLETIEWPGKYIPLVPVYGDEVVVEGERHFKSLIADAKDAQREHNYWRSMAAETIALAPRVPFVGPKGAFITDVEKWSTANTASHAFIEYDGPVPPQRQPYAGPSAGELQQAVNAAEDMKAIIGIFDASLGARSNETSGIAIRQRQRQGNIATFHFIDNLTRAIRHAGRVILDLIPRVYSTARIVRVLGEDMQPMSAAIAPAAQQQEMAMRAQARGQAIARIYDITAGKYDLVVRAGPSYGTQREEAREQIVEIMRSYPPSAPVLGPMFLRNSDWPGADEAAKKLEGGGENPQAQQMQQMQGMIQQGQQRLAQLEQENRELKAQTALKAQELQIKNKEAEARMLEAQAKAQSLLIEAAQPRVAPEPPSNPFGLG